MIERIVGGDDRHFGTALQCLCDRHTRLHPVLPGFVACCSDDTPDLLPTPDPVYETGPETLLSATVEDRCNEGTAVIVHQPDIGTPPVKDLQIAPTSHSHGNTFERGIKSTFRRSKETVYVDMQEHLSFSSLFLTVTKKKKERSEIWHIVILFRSGRSSISAFGGICASLRKG